jgi:hypothetical protein
LLHEAEYSPARYFLRSNFPKSAADVTVTDHYPLFFSEFQHHNQAELFVRVGLSGRYEIKYSCVNNDHPNIKTRDERHN